MLPSDNPHRFPSLRPWKEESSKVFAWALLIGTMVLIMIMFMAWFVVSPESFGLSPDDSKRTKSVNGFYYWATLTSTVGFGDITPKTESSKIVTSLYQLFLTMASLGAIWALTDAKVNKIVQNGLGIGPQKKMSNAHSHA